jgi:hypothetical protein
MLPVRWPPVFTSFRFHSINSEKPLLKLVAGLEKLKEVSITKACNALVTSNNDVSTALKWFQNNLAVSRAKQEVQSSTAPQAKSLLARPSSRAGRAHRERCPRTSQGPEGDTSRVVVALLYLMIIIIRREMRKPCRGRRLR